MLFICKAKAKHGTGYTDYALMCAVGAFAESLVLYIEPCGNVCAGAVVASERATANGQMQLVRVCACESAHECSCHMLTLVRTHLALSTIARSNADR